MSLRLAWRWLALRRREDGALPRESFKEKYFAYYDDVKSKSLKKQDW